MISGSFIDMKSLLVTMNFDLIDATNSQHKAALIIHSTPTYTEVKTRVTHDT